MKALKLILMMVFVSAFVSCANDDDYSTPDLSGECMELTANKNANDIIAGAGPVSAQYTADDIIEGYVTSSDEGGNFFKTISFITADTTKAFSVPVDAYNLYNKFEPGRKVYIKLKDLYVGKDFGATLIGARFGNRVGRIQGGYYKDVLIPSCTKIDENTFIKRRTIREAMNDKYLNMLIEFDSVQFTAPSKNATYYDSTLPSPGGSTNHKIVDRQGTELIVRGSSYATFAGEIVPSKSGKIRGVMTRFNNDYQFMIRTLNDVRLDQPRITKAPVLPGLEPPSASAVLAFAGSNFETFSQFTAGLNNFGLRPYATQSPGNGRNGSAALKISGNPAATVNDFAFNALAPANLPASPKKIHFYIKGTATKSLSINLYKPDGTYHVFNLVDFTDSRVLMPLTANQYTGVINTGGEWKLVVLDISTIAASLNLTDTTKNFFALKIGSNSAYDLYLDNFTIQP